MRAQKGLFARRAEFVQIPTQPERDLLGVEDFSGVGGRAMLGTTPALNASESLQRDQLRDVLAGIQAKIFITGQRRNLAERIALQENRHRTQHQVQMLGVREKGRK